MDRDQRLIAFCQQAVRIPSPSGQEREVAQLMKRKMEEYGFDEVLIDRHGSVLGRMRGRRPGKTILLDGHIDNVDVIDADEWTHDPFGGEIDQGRIYGRGTSDMKGSVTAMISAVAHFAEDSGRDFAGEICVSCTVHEECFEGVSSREITRLAKPDFVIIGEATSTTVKIGQRGRAEVVVETEGVSCHSSNPDKGVNAVYHMMAVIEEIRRIIEEAYAGDIIGVFDPGIFSIGDTLCSPGKKFRFDPIPTFAPEHFARVRPVDTMKRKQFLKGAEQIALEGAIQIFKLPYTGMEEVIVGVVGTLQFDVFQYRLRNEYNVEIRMDTLPYEYLRWIKEPVEFHETDLVLGNDTKLVEDYKGNKLLLFSSFWSIKWVSDHNPQLVLTEFNERSEEDT